MTAIEVFQGSDGAVTRAYYAALEGRGKLGLVAMNLFRAQKCSTRAKHYRGGIRGVGSYKDMAYERKTWSMGEAAKILMKHGDELGIRFGWKDDPGQAYHSWVLYVDLPGIGQVSFHSAARGEGPDYPGDWDGKRLSEARIIQFCDQVMSEGAAEQEEMFA